MSACLFSFTDEELNNLSDSELDAALLLAINYVNECNLLKTPDMTPEREKEIRLYHSGWLSNPYCSRGQHMDSKTIMELFEEIDRLRGEVTRYKEDYEHACETVAKMHAAAVGEVTGPKRGVIEDVQLPNWDRVVRDKKEET